jgi:hypothetical protein
VATRRRDRQKHWTDNGGVVAVALATAIFFPIIGLLVSVPCLVAARRAGAPTGLYVLAVALNLFFVAVMVVATRFIEPG